MTEDGAEEDNRSAPQAEARNRSDTFQNVSTAEKNDNYSVMNLSYTENKEGEDKDLGAAFMLLLKKISMISQQLAVKQDLIFGWN